MKKLFPLFLILCISFSFTACGKKVVDNVRTPNAESTPNENTEVSPLTIPEIKTDNIGEKTEGIVEYSLVTSKKKTTVGESFSVDVFMNTKSETVVSGQVYLMIDENMFDVEAIETKESDFPLWLDKTYLDTVRLTFADQVGVQKTQAKIATLKLKAKKAGNSDITFIAEQTLASKTGGGNVANMKKLQALKIEIK